MTSTKTVDGFGDELWYNEGGQLHREDGPAVKDADGTEEWWRDGELHRDDGPAITWADGTEEWWRDGVRVPAPEVKQ